MAKKPEVKDSLLSSFFQRDTLSRVSKYVKSNLLEYKLFVHIFKLLILTACLYYLFRCVSRLDYAQLKPVHVLCVLGTGFLYFLCTFISVQVWRSLLIFVHKSPIPFVDVSIVYFQSAMAKYIPSNVMHYAARHYMCKRFGLSQKDIFLSNVLEITLVLMAAIFLISGFIFFDIVTLPKVLAQNQSLIRKLILIFIVGVLITLAILIYKQTRKVRSGGAVFLSKVILAYVLDLVFLLVAGLVLSFLFWSIGANAAFSREKTSLFVFCYICSWTIGFVTPGAPGGLGVREAIMVMILGPQIGADMAIIGAIFFRLSTVSGEFFGYLFSRCLQFQQDKKTNASKTS